MKFRDENGGGWEIKQVLYADETELVAETREYLQPTVNEFKRPSDRMGLRVNVGKNKVLVIKKDQEEELREGEGEWGGNAEVDKFNYLGALIRTDSGMGEEVAHRVLEERKL